VASCLNFTCRWFLPCASPLLCNASGDDFLLDVRSPGSSPAGRLEATRELAYLHGQIGTQEEGAGNVARQVAKSLARIHWFARLGMGFAERFANRSTPAGDTLPD